MPRDSAQAERRRKELVEILYRDENVSTMQLAERFGVNPMTIRRDLEMLEAAGLALRRYGGAIASRRITIEFAFDERHRTCLEEKRRIGTQAAERITPGMTIFLDTGTTSLEVARALARRAVECQVVTSSLVAASELWGHPQIDLLLLGGRVRRGTPDLVGAGTEIMLDQLNGDIAFLGADGFDLQRGAFSSDLESARIADRMRAHSRQVVVVVDHSKFGKGGVARCLRIEDINELITDRAADREVIRALRRQNLKVTLA